MFMPGRTIWTSALSAPFTSEEMSNVARGFEGSYWKVWVWPFLVTSMVAVMARSARTSGGTGPWSKAAFSAALSVWNLRMTFTGSLPAGNSLILTSVNLL